MSPMIPDAQGFIFDFDDTLLDNNPGGTDFGLHERSRLAAAHRVGRRRKLQGLQTLTPQHAIDAFKRARIYRIDAIVWEMLLIAGVVQSTTVDPDNPILREVIELKEALHDNILRTYGREVPGAANFIKKLTGLGYEHRIAIASASNRRDIDTFLEMAGLDEIIPSTYRISREICKNAKPNPESYNLALLALNLPENARSRVIAVEDDPRGIQSAKAADLFTCAITTRFDCASLSSLEIAPDLIVQSFMELESLLHFSQEDSESCNLRDDIILSAKSGRTESSRI
jgi:beta-phosphoglucomutase-like phosphatase (HAD superfamily)